ncbi:MAG: hypothetical protein HWD61_05230 [Parachlamydiaceae bacterium]|nr:MAG: hypothetical protein HWD61_05230 [Parachlamydiaceae bacterium]
MDQRPDLVFKISNSNELKEGIENRYQNTVKGKQIIMQLGLDRLNIPSSKILSFEYNGAEYSMIAEKRLSFRSNPYEQEDLYYKNVEFLKPIVKQLASFIFEIGDNDVRFDNYPILDQISDQPLQCGVIDLEFAGHRPIDGFIGGKNGSIGLMGMMPTEELVDLLIEECKIRGLILEKLFEDTATIKANQLEKIAAYHHYHQFCENRGIRTGFEPFMQLEEIEKLELNLEEKGQYRDKTYKLRKAVSDVVNQMNKNFKSQNRFS